MATTQEALRHEKKRYPKTFLFWSEDESNYVGMVCKAAGKPYLAVRTGMTTQISLMDYAVPRASIVEVLAAGSYRIQDREDVTFFVISEFGLEVAVDRWPKLLFETINLQNRFCEINMGGELIKTDIKYGRGHGTIAPYTEEADASSSVEVSLPGISFYRVEGDVREEREKLKSEREERENKVLAALVASGGTRTEGRMLGLKFDKLVNVHVDVEGVKKGIAQKKDDKVNVSEWPSDDPADNGPKVEVQPGHQPLEGKSRRTSIDLKETPVQEDSVKAKANWKLLSESIMRMKTVREDAAGLRLVEPTHTSAFDSIMTSTTFDPLFVPVYKVDSHSKEYTRQGYAMSKRAHVIISGETLTILPESA
uniref:Non-structural protein NS2 n=1 Tax=Corriparta virus TaxID=40053 RepID=A0A8E8U6E4_9REOV|nr:Viral inclusion body protein [Corriparta virus]